MARDTGLSQSSPSSYILCNIIFGFINTWEHQPKMSYRRAICEKSVRLVNAPSDDSEEIIGQNVSEFFIPLYAKNFGEGVSASDFL